MKNNGAEANDSESRRALMKTKATREYAGYYLLRRQMVRSADSLFVFIQHVRELVVA